MTTAPMSAEERIAALEAERDTLRATIAAQDAKLDALNGAQSCGCSVDSVDDVCMHHSPQLAAAIAEIARLREALRRKAEDDAAARNLELERDAAYARRIEDVARAKGRVR